MKKYEYAPLFARVTVAMSAQDFGDWIYKKLNEWGAEGWHITQYNTPMTGTAGRQQAFTGELMATGCRQIQEGTVEAGIPFIGPAAEPGANDGLTIVEGMPMGQ